MRIDADCDTCLSLLLRFAQLRKVRDSIAFLSEDMVLSRGTLLGHFVTEADGIGRQGWNARSVGDGIHQYESVSRLNSL